jgi:hypothetical protein
MTVLIDNFDAYIDMLDPLTEDELFGEDDTEEKYEDPLWD